MAIQIKLFDNPFTWDVEPKPDQTIGQVMEQEEIEVPENFAVLKNMVEAGLSDPVADGDVLLVIPKIEGGVC